MIMDRSRKPGSKRLTDSFSRALANLGAGTGESPEGAVDRAASMGSDDHSRTFEIQVELPSGPYNEYIYDSERRSFRLQAVVRPKHPLHVQTNFIQAIHQNRVHL